jgi:hypothetical protein
LSLGFFLLIGDRVTMINPPTSKGVLESNEREPQGGSQPEPSTQWAGQEAPRKVRLGQHRDPEIWATQLYPREAQSGKRLIVMSVQIRHNKCAGHPNVRGHVCLQSYRRLHRGGVFYTGLSEMGGRIK